MSFKFEPLWTDILIYVLLAVVIAFIIIARRREHLRAPWREVMRSKMAMGCLVVLLAYLAVGLLDSIHFRPALAGAGNGRVDYSTEVLSVLDLAAAPLRSRVEKTYSAPFAAYSYARETVTRPDGTQVREFPRLQFGGAHLQDPAAERGRDILLRSLRALLVGGIIWLLSGALLVALLARRANTPFRLMLANIMRGRT